MNKVIDLTGLSRAITKIKEWVNGILDWNAQEGQDGYIKNKPLVSSIQKGNVYTFEGRLNYQEDGNTIEFDARYIDWYMDTGVLEVYVGVAGNGYEYEQVAKIIDIPGSFENNDIEIYMSDDNTSYVFKFKMVSLAEEKNITYKIISKLDYTPTIIHEDSISNKVIKTTPQTLTDTDKNQALANLGIDPVVWKYICNPLNVEDADNIPDELHSIIYSEDNNAFNGIIKNVLTLDNEFIGYISNDNEVITAVYKNTWVYNPESKEFTAV